VPTIPVARGCGRSEERVVPVPHEPLPRCRACRDEVWGLLGAEGQCTAWADEDRDRPAGSEVKGDEVATLADRSDSVDPCDRRIVGRGKDEPCPVDVGEVKCNERSFRRGHDGRSPCADLAQQGERA